MRFVRGHLADGRAVEAVRLQGGGMQAEVWAYGALLQSLRLPGGLEALSGPRDLEQAQADGNYHGVVIGRVANRIGGASFTLDGREHRLEANDRGATLHGGVHGWSRRLWRFEGAEESACTLAYDSPDGDAGFPGAVHARVRLSLGATGLEIAWEATADAPTPVAMTHHLYFNLSGEGGGDTLGHTLRIAADRVSEVGPTLAPTGRELPVEGSVLDLRTPRTLAELKAADHPLLRAGGGLDLNYVLSRGEDAVTLACPASGVSLHISTDQPGCQAYGGQGLGAPFAPYGGVALEPQAIPGAVNHPTLGDVTLRPGATYRRFARYRFETAAPRG